MWKSSGNLKFRLFCVRSLGAGRPHKTLVVCDRPTKFVYTSSLPDYLWRRPSRARGSSWPVGRGGPYGSCRRKSPPSRVQRKPVSTGTSSDPSEVSGGQTGESPRRGKDGHRMGEVTLSQGKLRRLLAYTLLLCSVVVITLRTRSPSRRELKGSSVYLKKFLGKVIENSRRVCVGTSLSFTPTQSGIKTRPVRVHHSVIPTTVVVVCRPS